MKQMIAVVIAGFLLCSGTAAFAQSAVTTPDTSAGTATPDSGQGSQAQSAINALSYMSPEQRQQLFEMGVAQVQKLTPDQIKQYKAEFDNLAPEQKEQLQAQINQQLQNDPQLKSAAQAKLQNLTPEQRQQLTDIIGQEKQGQ